MLSTSEEKRLFKVLSNLSKKYPGKSYIDIMYDARRFCAPTLDLDRAKYLDSQILQYCERYDAK